jgi:hypothetical protein
MFVGAESQDALETATSLDFNAKAYATHYLKTRFGVTLRK